MKIVFLGTSHGLPEKDRRCSCTLLKVGEKSYLIDAGAPFVDMMLRRNENPYDLSAIFITHTHGDHMDGLSEFIDLTSWYYTKSPTQVFIPEQRAIGALKEWTRAMNGDGIRIGDMRVYEAGEIYKDDTITVRAYRTNHTGTSHCFVIEGEGKRVYFSGDISSPDRDFPAECFEKNFDIIVCESAHVNVADAKDTFERCKTNRIYLNHYAPYRKAAVEEMMSIARGYSLTLAEDEMEVDV